MSAGTCFVIQPFDGGRFDKRYEDVFAPAISDAGLDAYRVDRDPNTSIPIDDIQSGIESAAICLADISLDNPNVWFELGYAIAVRREVVLACSDERKSEFPFDVQHRSIVQYATESSRDFIDLRKRITARLAAALKRRDRLQEVVQIQSLAPLQGLEQHEVAALVSVAEESEDPESGISAIRVRQAMESAGFTKIATAIGLRKLTDGGMVELHFESDSYGEPYRTYRVTPLGMTWLHENRNRLALRHEGEKASRVDEDEIPF